MSVQTAVNLSILHLSNLTDGPPIVPLLVVDEAEPTITAVGSYEKAPEVHHLPPTGGALVLLLSVRAIHLAATLGVPIGGQPLAMIHGAPPVVPVVTMSALGGTLL